MSPETQAEIDRINTMTHRARVRLELPDGQVIETHIDVPVSEALPNHPYERCLAFGEHLARTWIQNWTKAEVTALEPLAPEERWRRGIDADPMRRNPKMTERDR